MRSCRYTGAANGHRFRPITAFSSHVRVAATTSATVGRSVIGPLIEWRQRRAVFTAGSIVAQSEWGLNPGWGIEFPRCQDNGAQQSAFYQPTGKFFHALQVNLCALQAADACCPGTSIASVPRELHRSLKDNMRSLQKPAGIALVLIDFINLLPGEPSGLGPRAVRAARRTALLKQRAKAARIPVIYANDHFGDWRSDFPSLVKKCANASGHSRELAEILCPGKDDYSVLK